MPYHQFDLVSTQTCATKDALLVKKYHYGGIAIRGNSQWMEKDDDGNPKGTMLTSEGKTRKNGNHSRPRWVAMHGPVNGQECGVVVMNHPDNFRYPQWVRLHPSMPYFVYAPMVKEPFSIVPGKPYRLEVPLPDLRRETRPQDDRESLEGLDQLKVVKLE